MLVYQRVNAVNGPSGPRTEDDCNGREDLEHGTSFVRQRPGTAVHGDEVLFKMNDSVTLSWRKRFPQEIDGP